LFNWENHKKICRAVTDLKIVSHTAFVWVIRF
jgi:hypothetical protein